MKTLISIILYILIVLTVAACSNVSDLTGEETAAEPTATPKASETAIPDLLTQDKTSEDAAETQVKGRDDMTALERIHEYLESEDFLPPEGFDKERNSVRYGEIVEIEYFSATTDAVRKCNIYLPPDFDENTTYPVLYLLHGIGGDHREWLSGKPNEIISNLLASEKIKPLIVVMPNIRARQNDTDLSDMYSPEAIAAFDNFINDLRDDLMPYINENYPVSDKREECMVAGLSMGGRESLYIGVSMPETFGYIGAFCPAPGLLEENLGYPAQIDPEEFKLPYECNENTFILINTGDDDGLVGDNPKNYHETLNNNGARSFFYSTPGGHDFKVWKNGLYYFLISVFKAG